MTKNQIEYAKHLETRRANQANERLTKQRDERAHTVALGQLSETQRANRAKEAQAIASLDETIRTNKATEAIRIGDTAVSAANAAERVRSNLAREAETALHNRAMELKDYASKVDVSPVTLVQPTPMPQSSISPDQVTVIVGLQPQLPGVTTDVKRIEGVDSVMQINPVVPRVKTPDYQSGQSAAQHPISKEVSRNGKQVQQQQQVRKAIQPKTPGKSAERITRGGGFGGGSRGGGFSPSRY